MEAERCYACGRKISGKAQHVAVFAEILEPQSYPVGPDCYRKIRNSDRLNRTNQAYEGWQPPNGGPKLCCIGSLG